MMEEMIDPVIDRLIKYNERIEALKKEQKYSQVDITKLQDAVFNTDKKMDVFEEIDVKIAKAVADIKNVENTFLYDRQQLHNRMDQI